MGDGVAGVGHGGLEHLAERAERGDPVHSTVGGHDIDVDGVRR